MTSPQSSQMTWPLLRSSAHSTPPYVTCHIGGQPRHPLASPPRPCRPNERIRPLHDALPPQQAKIPHPYPTTLPPLPATSTLPWTAPTMTPTLEKCSATPSYTPRLSPTLGRRSNFAPANMTCRNSPQQPSTRITNPNLPTYAQAAGSGRPRGKNGKKATTTEVAQPAGEPLNPATSLPFAS